MQDLRPTPTSPRGGPLVIIDTISIVGPTIKEKKTSGGEILSPGGKKFNESLLLGVLCIYIAVDSDFPHSARGSSFCNLPAISPPPPSPSMEEGKNKQTDGGLSGGSDRRGRTLSGDLALAGRR